MSKAFTTALRRIRIALALGLLAVGIPPALPGDALIQAMRMEGSINTTTTQEVER
jgi:hypothetical protein